jgi:TRAP-type mannitol/chloroaromatic compound transport system permease large subunit
VVTVIGAEIGLLTPPLGLSVFTVKSADDDPSITLYDIFAGAFPFAVIMLLVLIAIIAFPGMSLALI